MQSPQTGRMPASSTKPCSAITPREQELIPECWPKLQAQLPYPDVTDMKDWRWKLRSKNHRLQKALWIQLTEGMWYCAFNETPAAARVLCEGMQVHSMPPGTMRSPEQKRGGRRTGADRGLYGLLLEPPLQNQCISCKKTDTSSPNGTECGHRDNTGAGCAWDPVTTQEIGSAPLWKRKQCG